MQPSNQPRDFRQAVRPYLAAAAIVAVFGLIQYAAQSYLQQNAPLGMFVVAVTLTALIGGGGPALAATIASVLIGSFFFLDPPLSFAIARPQDRVLIAFFTFICLCMTVMGWMLSRTRRKAAELMSSLRQSEETTRALLESSSQAVLAVGQDGRIRIASEATLSIFGYRPQEVIGQPIDMLIPERDPHRQGRGLFGGARPDPGTHGLELEGRRKDGSFFPAEATLSITDTPTGTLAVGFIADVTSRKELEATLLRERSELKSIMDHSPVLISTKDLEGRIAMVNRSFLEALGMRADQVVGRLGAEVYSRETARMVQDMDRQVLETREPCEFNITIQHADGLHYTYHAMKFPVSYLHTDEPFAICTFLVDITEQKKAEEKVLHAARHDSLTGLPNRALVYELGAQLLRSSNRENARAAVLFFDLDRFKPVNDTYGHTVGDRMLQEVANRLRGAVRSSDLVGRLGGDEFIAILSNIESEAGVAQAARNLLERLSEPYEIDTLELRTSPSIGVSLYPDHATDIDTLIRQADAAMYHAKSRGRNTWQFYTSEINANTENAFALEQRMRHGIHCGDFELVYQPIVDTQTMEVVGAEALIRWPQKNAATLMPDQFIAAAETSGLINQIGDWVIQEACHQQEAWCRCGLPPLRMAINVSPIQFRSRDFQSRVRAAIEESGVDPTCVELEVTESTVMKHVQEAERTLANLKEMGLRIALDDFGTGYSSLSHLSQLPIDKLKVDRSFIRNMHTNARSLAIAETVIALGKKLAVEIVAEGIESDVALDMLRERGCDLGQGYLISAPMSGDAFADWYLRKDLQRVLH